MSEADSLLFSPRSLPSGYEKDLTNSQYGAKTNIYESAIYETKAGGVRKPPFVFLAAAFQGNWNGTRVEGSMMASCG